MYPVPYFDGCTLHTVQQISKLWLSQNMLYHYNFKYIFDSITVKLVKDANSASVKTNGDFIEAKQMLKTNGDFIEAKQMLCKELKKRRAKAGARLLWLFLFWNRHDYSMLKGMFRRPRGTEFKRRFLDLQEGYWHLVGTYVRPGYNGTDHAEDGEGKFINVGLPSSHTDYNLLCWAARRGYSDLIWLVVQIYKPSSKSDPHYYIHHVLRVIDAWKCALSCVTRHGQTEVILKLLAPGWITDTIDFNDYPWGWLPPLHLVALLGDMAMLNHLAKVEKLFASKKDYLGRTPLDYAMAFMSTTNKIKHYFVSKPFQKDKKDHKLVVKKLLLLSGVEERLKELYGMYIIQANTVLIGAALIASVAFVGWLQPPLGYTDYFQFTEPSPPAPTSTYKSYVAIEGHLNIELFIVFNALSFFLAIATMFVGAEATLFVRDKHERTKSLIKMRKSIKWMLGFFISSILSIMVAFICAGLAVLPPIQRLMRSMIVSLSVGTGICVIPLAWILWSLTENRIFFSQSHELDPLKDHEDYNKSLIDEYSYIEKMCHELFKKWDADGDGSISVMELLLKWENGRAEVEVHEIIDKADEDGDCRVNYEEFKKLMMMMSEEPSSQLDVSARLEPEDEDKDNSGTGLGRRPRRHDQPEKETNRQLITGTVHEADEDFDGQVNYKEFVKISMPQHELSHSRDNSASTSNSAINDIPAPTNSSPQPEAQSETHLKVQPELFNPSNQLEIESEDELSVD